MKDLNLIYTGGHPLQIDDLKHIQDGMRELFQELGNVFTTGTAPAILYGAVLSNSGGGHQQNTKGLLFIDGELLPMAAAVGSGPLDTDTEYQVLEDYVAPSPVVYGDLVSRNVHRHRYVVLGRSTARPGNFVAGYSPTALVRISNNWVKPTLSTDWIHQDINTQGGDLMYTKDHFSQKVELKGCCHYVTGAVPGSVVLFTLPVGSRPSSKQIRQLYNSANLSGTGFEVNSHSYCVIDTNGDVSVDINAGANVGYHFGGVYFYL